MLREVNILQTEHSGRNVFLVQVERNLCAKCKKFLFLPERCFKPPIWGWSWHSLCLRDVRGLSCSESGCVVHEYSFWILRSLDTAPSSNSLQVKLRHPLNYSSLFVTKDSHVFILFVDLFLLFIYRCPRVLWKPSKEKVISEFCCLFWFSKCFYHFYFVFIIV